MQQLLHISRLSEDVLAGSSSAAQRDTDLGAQVSSELGKVGGEIRRELRHELALIRELVEARSQSASDDVRLVVRELHRSEEVVVLCVFFFSFPFLLFAIDGRKL